ncbi:hypothetical protein TSOC_004914 [Tetrabaena socialis]|uniref:C2H2-type domain-containing protein n=1 Tax=Tetrabaena socialis TaxID=47790 RepID=A0A2J8A7K4_9CHLO|nr:hypothetical protein TSOC_004914 [Tetrabaena socialis]|eukprot:PNH08514.1 hypothetical protein TSOC_004914 [Tetrabaena socialis]
MDLEEPGESGLQLDLAPGSPSSRAADAKNRDPDRFYCPFPGCNRSFAELWRLKVHYRAPPDIRGSGKERGHGTELTHCPKCGKTLKPGKHHVGCSGGKAAARQTNKRSRPAGDADLADDAPIASPSGKHGRGNDLDVDLGVHPPGWPTDFAQPNGAYAVVLPPAHMKLERPEWTAMQPGIIYAQPGASTSCWVQPGQVNGLVPQMQGHLYHHAQFPAVMQYTGGAPGYLQQVPSYAGLAGFPIAEQGQIMSLQPGASLQPHMGVMHGMPHGALPVMSPLMLQQHHQHHEHGTKQEHEAAGMPSNQLDSLGQQQQQPLNSAVQLHQQHALGMPQHGHPQQQQQQPHQQQHILPDEPEAGRAGGGLAQEGGGGGGAGPSAGAGGDGGGGGAALPPAKPTTSGNESLDSIFGDVEEFTRDFGRIPSPPPLPTDFHSASGGGGGMLFNFGQFTQKLPRAQSHTRLDRNLDRPRQSLGARANERNKHRRTHLPTRLTMAAAKNAINFAFQPRFT